MKVTFNVIVADIFDKDNILETVKDFEFRKRILEQAVISVDDFAKACTLRCELRIINASLKAIYQEYGLTFFGKVGV